MPPEPTGFTIPQNLLDFGASIGLTEQSYLNYYSQPLVIKPTDPEKGWRRAGPVMINDVTGERQYVGGEGIENLYGRALGGLTPMWHNDLALGIKYPSLINTNYVKFMTDQDLNNRLTYFGKEVDWNNGLLEAAAGMYANISTGPGGMAGKFVAGTGEAVTRLFAMATDQVGSLAQVLGADDVGQSMKDSAGNMRMFWKQWDDDTGIFDPASSGSPLKDTGKNFKDALSSYWHGDAQGTVNAANELQNRLWSGFNKMGADMLTGYLIGNAAFGVLGASGLAPQGLLRKALITNSEVALGFQAMTTADMYNGLAERDVNRLAATVGSVIGGRLTGWMEGIAFDRWFKPATRLFGKEFQKGTREAIWKGLQPGATWSQQAKSYAIRSVNPMITESVTEMSQEVTQRVGEEISATLGSSQTLGEAWKNVYNKEFGEQVLLAGVGALAMTPFFGGAAFQMDRQVMAWEKYLGEQQEDAVLFDSARSYVKGVLDQAKQADVTARDVTNVPDWFRKAHDDAISSLAAQRLYGFLQDAELERDHWFALRDEAERLEAEAYGMTPEQIRAERAKGRGDLPVLPVEQQLTEQEIANMAHEGASFSPRLAFDTEEDRRISYELIYEDLATTFQGNPVSLVNLAAATGNAPIEVAEAVRRMADAGIVQVGEDGMIRPLGVMDKVPFIDAATAGWDKAGQKSVKMFGFEEGETRAHWTARQEQEQLRRQLGIALEIPILDGMAMGKVLADEYEDIDGPMALALGVNAALTSRSPAVQNARRKAMMTTLNKVLTHLDQLVKSGQEIPEGTLDRLLWVAESLADGANARQERLRRIKNRILKLQGATTQVSPTLSEEVAEVTKKEERNQRKEARQALRKMGVPYRNQSAFVDEVAEAEDKEGAAAGALPAGEAPAFDFDSLPEPESARGNKGQVVQSNARQKIRDNADKDTKKAVRRAKAAVGKVLRELDANAEALQGQDESIKERLTQQVLEDFTARHPSVPPTFAYRILHEQMAETRKQLIEQYMGTAVASLLQAANTVKDEVKAGTQDVPGDYDKDEALAVMGVTPTGNVSAEDSLDEGDDGPYLQSVEHTTGTSSTDELLQLILKHSPEEMGIDAAAKVAETRAILLGVSTEAEAAILQMFRDGEVEQETTELEPWSVRRGVERFGSERSVRLAVQAGGKLGTRELAARIAASNTAVSEGWQGDLELVDELLHLDDKEHAEAMLSKENQTKRGQSLAAARVAAMHATPEGRRALRRIVWGAISARMTYGKHMVPELGKVPLGEFEARVSPGGKALAPLLSAMHEVGLLTDADYSMALAAVDGYQSVGEDFSKPSGVSSAQAKALNDALRVAHLMSNVFSPVTLATTIARLEETKEGKRNWAVGLSAAAMVDTIAANWARRERGRTKEQFWTSALQNLDLAYGSERGGFFYQAGKDDGKGPQMFGRRMVSLEASWQDKGYANVFVHEFGHALLESGLIREILTPEQMKRLEATLGVPLPSGKGEYVLTRASERFAHMLQMYTGLGVARDEMLRDIFRETSRSMAEYLQAWQEAGTTIFRDVFPVSYKPGADAVGPEDLLSLADIIVTPEVVEVFDSLFKAADDGPVFRDGPLALDNLSKLWAKDIARRAGLDEQAIIKFILAKAQSKDPNAAKALPPVSSGGKPLKLKGSLVEIDTSNQNADLEADQPGIVSFQEWLRRRGWPEEIHDGELLARLRDEYEVDRLNVAYEIEREWESRRSAPNKPPKPPELTAEDAAALSTVGALSFDSEYSKRALADRRRAYFANRSVTNQQEDLQWHRQQALDFERSIQRPLGNVPESRFRHAPRYIRTGLDWAARLPDWLMEKLYKRPWHLLNWLDKAKEKAGKEGIEGLRDRLERGYYYASNIAGIGSRIAQVTQEVPSVVDQVTKNRKVIGTESLASIFEDIGRAHERIRQRQRSEGRKQVDYETLVGDLDVLMVEQRQMELKAQEDFDYEEYVRTGVRPERRRRHTSPQRNVQAQASLLILRGEYGDEGFAELDELARRISQWSHHAVIGKLVNAGMISQEDADKMFARGERYAPLMKVYETVGAANWSTISDDESLKDVVFALKDDATDVEVPPIKSMIRKAAAVEAIVARQLVRNDVYEGMVKLYEDRELRDEVGDMGLLYQAKKKGDASLALPIVGKDAYKQWRKDYERIKGKGALDRMTPQVYARWVDGVPHYFVVRDPGLRVALQKISSAGASLILKIAETSVHGVEERNVDIVQFVKKITRQLIGRPIVATVPFVYNSATRDIPALFGKSRFGVTGADLLYGAFQSLGTMFPSLTTDQKFAKTFELARDHIDSMSGMGGVLSMVHDPHMIDLEKSERAGREIELGRTERRARLKRDFRTKMEERGWTNKRQALAMLKRGDVGRLILAGVENAMTLVLSPFETATEMQDVGWRLAERSAASKIDADEQAAERFPPHVRKALGAKEGDRLTFSGWMHRIRYATRGKDMLARMREDPTYVPSSAEMKKYLPIPVSDAEVDFSQRAVTVDFNQRGTWSPFLGAMELFIQPNINEWGYAMEMWKRSGKRLPLLLKVFSVYTIPMLLNYLRWHDDDDWKYKPLHEKLTYIDLWKQPDGRFKRLPWGIGFIKAVVTDPLLTVALVANEQAPELTERRGGKVREWLVEVAGADRVWMNAGAEVMDRILEQSPSTFFWNPVKTAVNKDLLTGAFELATPSVLEPGLEFITNWDFYRQQPLERTTSYDGEEVNKNARRYGMMQNFVAKALGVSPAKAAHLMRSYLPGVPGILLTEIPNRMAGEPQDPTAYKGVSGPLVRTTAAPPVSWDPWGPSTEHVKIFYDFRDQLGRVENDIRQARKVPGGETRVMQLVAEHQSLLELKQVIDAVAEEMSAMRGWRSAIMANKSLSLEEQNVMLTHGGDGDNGVGPDKRMTLLAIEANRRILEHLTRWRQMHEGQ